MFGGLFSHFSKHFSAFHSIVIVWAGYIRLLFKLPLKFRNVLQHTESRSSFACNQNFKEDIFTKLEALLCFEAKGNETLTNPPRKHPRNARVTSAKELGTMSKHNLIRITLVREPIWGIHSLTLIISCLVPSYVAPMYNCILPCVCIYSYVTLMYSYVTHICYSYVLVCADGEDISDVTSTVSQYLWLAISNQKKTTDWKFAYFKRL